MASPRTRHARTPPSPTPRPRGSGRTAERRVRRDPEEARRLILDAAEGLFAVKSPDVVGLKEVAEAAGVSHALVSHYFGTYGGLVEATLERRMTALRAQVFEQLLEPAAEARTRVLVERLWSVASDPVTLRLGAWALLSGRLDSEEFFAGRVQGLRQVADGVERKLRSSRKLEKVAREDIEFILMAALALMYGYAITGAPSHAGLGRAASPEADLDFRERVVEMLELYLARRR